MSEVVSFTDYTPPARFDAVPWEAVQIYEAPEITEVWTLIDTIALSPLDPDPADPAERDFTTSLGTAPELWYYVVFIDGSDGKSLPTDAFQNTAADAPYATIAELFRVLKISSPSEDQTDAAAGDLQTATLEINQEIDWADDHAPLTQQQIVLLKGVCIDRAADLWRHRESAPGILGVVDESMQSGTGRYSWSRYAARLSAIKDQWGIA